MAYENIIVDRKGQVAVITLNRPKALNALNSQLIGELNQALDGYEADDEIGAILLTGGEKAFAAGADIKEMMSKDYIEASMGDFIADWDRLARCKKPTIAAVSGYALGGGCEISMMCDIVLASDTAKFGQPEINLGIIPGAGGTQRLTRAVGKAKAMEMVLTGRMMDAEEAERSGLVSRIFPVDELMEEALKVAGRIAHLSRPSVVAAKAAVNRAYEVTLAEGVLFERTAFYGLFATEDQTEGMSAFAEKREPNFQNK